MQEERSRTLQSGATKPLSVMDVVELSEREGGEGGSGRPRAMVLKTQGVPGLNKISVRYVHMIFHQFLGPVPRVQTCIFFVVS